MLKVTSVNEKYENNFHINKLEADRSQYSIHN